MEKSKLTDRIVIRCYVDYMNMTVLIIEDDKDLQLLFREQFEQHGITVLIADNGKIGLEVLSRETVDLVLTDVRMPVMTGMEFLKQAKGLCKLLPPIIIMTGGSIYTAKQFYDEGASGYVEKFDFTVEQVLGYSKKSA